LQLFTISVLLNNESSILEFKGIKGLNESSILKLKPIKGLRLGDACTFFISKEKFIGRSEIWE